MVFAISTLSGAEPVVEGLKVVRDKRFENGGYLTIEINSPEELSDLIEKLDLPVFISRKHSDIGIHEIQIMDHFE